MAPPHTPPPSNAYYGEADSDEAIALEMYRRQHLERQSQQQSAATMFTTAPPPFNPNTTNTTTTMNDESYARRLQQQEQDEQFALDIQEQIHREEQLLSGGATTTHVTPPAATEDDDVQFALQVEQQMRDEDLARQVAAEEERNLEARQQRAQAAAVNTPGRSTRRRICGCLIPFLLVGAGIAIWWFLIAANNGTTGNGGPIIPGGIPWLQDNDPFEGKNPDEVPKWDNGARGSIVQSGLQLTVVNAMESTWDDVFPLVLNDWDNGNPDTLALTVENAMQSDPDCTEIYGKSKVCNGNYGNTQWKGINMVILDYNDYIAASTSKMNEYYLAQASTAQRRYTLCHEIGHSFGLPHTDENFYNRDLGNCMDYTSNPAVNQQPDESNYLFLKDLYGVLPSWAENTIAPTFSPTDDGDGGGRMLRRQQPPVATHDSNNDDNPSSFPDHIQNKIRELATHHSHSLEQLQENGWRLLHSTHHGQEHEMELGDGWTIRMHKLLHHDS